MGEAIPSGGSAFVVVIDERWEEELSKYVARSGARETYQFDHEASARLLGLQD